MKVGLDRQVSGLVTWLWISLLSTVVIGLDVRLVLGILSSRRRRVKAVCRSSVRRLTSVVSVGRCAVLSCSLHSVTVLLWWVSGTFIIRLINILVGDERDLVARMVFVLRVSSCLM